MRRTRGSYEPKSDDPIVKFNNLLTVNSNRRKLKNSLLWGLCNISLFGIVFYDISNTSSNYVPSILYAEYFLLSLFSFNILYHVACYLNIFFKCGYTNTKVESPVPVQEKKTRLQFLTYNTFKPIPNDKTSSITPTSTPINLSAVSWRSNVSSINSSLNSSNEFNQSSPNVSLSKMFYNSSECEFIKDEHSLKDYLKRYEDFEKSFQTNSPSEQQSNLLASFWSHPSAKTLEGPIMLNKCNYQLSSQPSTSPSNQPDGKHSRYANNSIADTWKRFNIRNETLTQWNSNIRKWLSQTILECLTQQFDQIDAALQKHGVSDVQIGCVGLDHLRKTAQSSFVLQIIPSLSILIPFLEVSSNQEYLVKRIRQLSKGGCISDFKWNSGSSHNQKEWNDSLPTDSEIMMHLFITYMDSQLLPLPNHPEIKPFSGHYYIKFNQQVPTSIKFAIQHYSLKPPHFKVLVGNEVFEMVQGYNNLFHTILFFLYQVHKIEYGMLGGINLGKSGVNILWVINQ